MPKLSFTDVISQLASVDDADAPERAKSSPALSAALRISRPRNWWGSGIPGDSLLRIAVDDGIPLAWVPPLQIVCGVAQRPSRDDRIFFLLRNAEEVVDQCEEVIGKCVHPELGSTQPLAASAVRAWKAGEGAAAMALAVNLAEDLAFDVADGSRAFRSEEAATAWDQGLRQSKSGYARAKYCADHSNPYVIHSFVEDVVRAPIQHFFETWHKSSGVPAPSRLCRHVAVHRPSSAHYTPANRLLSIMLVASFMREMQETLMNAWEED